MDASPPASGSALPLADDGTLSTDVACLHCGYNLRGLSPDTTCHECGLPVGRSVHGDLLRYRDPLWVGQLSQGMNYIVVGLLVGLVFGCIGNVIDEPSLAQIINLLPWTVQLLGFWMVTTPDPAKLETEAPLSARRLTRWLPIGEIGLHILTLFHSTYPAQLAISLGLASMPIGLAHIFATGIYAMELARRAPDAWLVWHTRFCMWGFGVSYLMMVPGSILALIQATQSTPLTISDDLGPLIAPLCGGAIGLLVFAIYTLVLIFSYRTMLNEAARHARVTWAMER